MFVGAYWSERKETRNEVAERVTSFLGGVALHLPQASTWLRKGRTRSEALRSAVAVTSSALAGELKVNRRDVGGEVIAELGYHLGLWNPAGASVSITCGAYSPHVGNAAVLRLDESLAVDIAVYRRLLDEIVRAFDPDQAVVTNHDHLERARAEHPWEAGLLTYKRLGRTVLHLLETTQGGVPFATPSSPGENEWVRRLRDRSHRSCVVAKLIDVVERLAAFDPEATIYVVAPWTCDSEVVVAHEPGDGGRPPEAESRNATYFIEVFLAREFLADWRGAQRRPVSAREQCERLIQYALNDS